MNGNDTETEVVESILIKLKGTGAQILAQVSVWERLLSEAEDYAKTSINQLLRVMIRARLDTGESLYESVVLGGWISWNSRKPQISLVSQFAEITVSVRRQNFWDAVTPIVIPLTNRYATRTTSAIAVDNRDDSTHDNFVTITGTDVLGSLPGATKIEFKNTFNDSLRAGDVYFFLNRRSAPASFQHMIEGESATSGGSTVADANASGGNTRTVTIAATGETTMYYWDLTTTVLDNAKGNLFRIYGSFKGLSSVASTWIKLFISIAGLTILSEGKWKIISGYTGALVDFGTFRLPPYLVDTGSVYPLRLHMVVKTTNSTSRPFDLDYLLLGSVDENRVLRSNGYGLGYNVTLYDDPKNRALYTDGWSSTGKLGNYIGIGDPIKLWPGADSKLYFLWGSQTGSWISKYTATVKISHYPRKRAL